MKAVISRIQEFSVPLIVGVLAGMFAANSDLHSYETVIHGPLLGLGHFFGLHADPGVHSGWMYFTSMHFLANDVFMALFFGIAAKEITEACLPNGALNPPSKAVNPLIGTLGGVLGPIGAYLGLNWLFGDPAWSRGWGIPTATDIALAWLVARLLFGKGHPAVSFLLLLAVADDAIGLGIIAFGYPDPAHPTVWFNCLWMLPGIAIALTLRLRNVHAWWPYIVFGGAFCWWGLFSAHLHPALALVCIVPFLPGPKTDLGFFREVDVDEYDNPATEKNEGEEMLSPLEHFEHDLKIYVDFGLFFFAFANAGVPLAGVSGLTWLVLAALLLGKVVGITGFSWAADRMGFKLPEGMTTGDLFVTSIVAALGLTVALFVSTQAFSDPGLQGAAKMGAVLSAAAALLAWIAKVMLKSQRSSQPKDNNEPEVSEKPAAANSSESTSEVREPVAAAG